MNKLWNDLQAIGDFLIKFTTVITPIVIAWFGWLQYKVRNKVTAISEKQDLIHKEMNGMKDQLVKTTKEAGIAQGNLQGREEQTREQKEQTK